MMTGAARFPRSYLLICSRSSFWTLITVSYTHLDVYKRQEYVRELLGVPKHMAILNIIAVGYPEERLPAHTLNEIKTERVHKEIY